MPGCGKTTISKELSEKLELPLLDIDTDIVETYQMSIPEMFEISEEYFRERETLCCQKASKKQGSIISTGGGIILNPQNITYLKENGIIVYLDRPVTDILNDVEVETRPLLKNGPERLYALYQERHQKYIEACDIHILNTEKIAVITDKIITEVNKLEK